MHAREFLFSCNWLHCDLCYWLNNPGKLCRNLNPAIVYFNKRLYFVRLTVSVYISYNKDENQRMFAVLQLLIFLNMHLCVKGKNRDMIFIKKYVWFSRCFHETLHDWKRNRLYFIIFLESIVDSYLNARNYYHPH